MMIQNNVARKIRNKQHSKKTISEGQKTWWWLQIIVFTLSLLKRTRYIPN